MSSNSVLIVLASLFAASSAHAATTPIGMTPSSAWSVSGSGVGPLCDPASPAETNWAESAGDGVTLGVVATNIQCCDCIRRSAVFKIGNTDVAGAHLTGKFVGQNVGTYAAASFRVSMTSGAAGLGKKAFATEQRANNNCVGKTEEPLTIVSSGSTFDIDLSTIATSASAFDAIQIDVLGYACPDGQPPEISANAILSDVTLTGPKVGTMRIGPTTPTDIKNSPWAKGPDAPEGGTAATSGGSAGSGSKGGCNVGDSSGASGLAALVMAVAFARWRSRRKAQ